LEGWKVQVKEAAEKNFKKEKSKFQEQLQTKMLLQLPLLDFILENKEWKKAKE
jgi:hypothetical protein